MDKDNLLAEALGISISELHQARDNNVTYEELLVELNLTEDEVRTAHDAAFVSAVQQAVDEGSLTTAQAENGRMAVTGMVAAVMVAAMAEGHADKTMVPQNLLCKQPASMPRIFVSA